MLILVLLLPGIGLAAKTEEFKPMQVIYQQTYYDETRNSWVRATDYVRNGGTIKVGPDGVVSIQVRDAFKGNYRVVITGTTTEGTPFEFNGGMKVYSDGGIGNCELQPTNQAGTYGPVTMEITSDSGERRRYDEVYFSLEKTADKYPYGFMHEEYFSSSNKGIKTEKGYILPAEFVTEEMTANTLTISNPLEGSVLVGTVGDRMNITGKIPRMTGKATFELRHKETKEVIASDKSEVQDYDSCYVEMIIEKPFISGDPYEIYAKCGDYEGLVNVTLVDLDAPVEGFVLPDLYYETDDRQKVYLSTLTPDENGEMAPIEPTAVFNDETFAQLLAQTDVSPWAFEAAKQVQHIPLPESVESFQQQVTREEFASILIGYYEWLNDYLFGTLADGFSGDLMVGESSIIAAADALGLVPGIADPYAQNSAAQPVNVGEAIGSLIVLLDENGALSLAQLQQIQGISPETLLSFLRDWGFMRSEGLVDLKAEDALTVEAALAMLWEAELVQGLKALGQILQQSAYQQSNNALQEAVYSGKEGDPLIGILTNSDHGLSLNSVLMYTQFVDVDKVFEQGVEGRANGIVAQLQAMNKKWSKYTKEKMPADLKGLKQKKGLKPLKAYPNSVQTVLQEDGSILLSGLVWFDDNGRMFEDAVYVYTGLIFKDQDTGKTAMQEALLADQTFASTYMELYRSDLQWFAQEALSVEYPELSKDMKGDEVKALQEKLKALGYYSGKADGKYSKKVVTAVKKFQKACGLEETGVADSLTQQKIYTWDDVNVMLLDWLDSK
ncbi:MAG: peptidoglycan-binding protein [Clostridia bacterium]|nr:peptidoglycan-binding protein [Clostridia bacterium]